MIHLFEIDWGGHPFYWEAYDSHEEALDYKCWQMLHSLVPIWPSPVVNGEL